MKKFIVTSALLGLLILLPSKSLAADLKLQSQQAAVNVGSTVQVNLTVNSDNESINAAAGEIVYPTDLLKLEEIESGNSILTFWVDKPSEKTSGTIVFSGVTPGGFVLQDAPVLSLVFQTLKEGDAEIKLQNTQVLKNDGQGTVASLNLIPFKLNISPSAPASSVQVQDKDAPDKFTPTVEHDPNVFEGKYFLVFATQDKGSGINRYEVKEGRGKYQEASSPYLLVDQDLTSDISVKAIDNKGNVRIAKIAASHPLWYKKFEFFAIVLIAAFLLASLRQILFKKRTKK